MGEITEKINRPYFSVILPIYNVEDWLRECVESVLAQIFKDYELILVDDGASDSSGSICDAYARDYSHITVIHKENGGLSSARNAGFDVARGEYIWWVDSDDRIEKDALEKLWRASRELCPDMIKFAYYRSGEKCKEQKIAVSPGVYSRSRGLDELVDAAFFHGGKFCLSAWSHVYRRDFLSENRLGFVSERLTGSEDYVFNLQALTAAGSVVVLEDALYYYRLRLGSLSRNYRQGLDEKYGVLRELLEEHYKRAGVYPVYREKLNYFYVWHLIFGTCISREYRREAGRDMDKGREKVRGLLRSKELQKALVNGAQKGLSGARRIQHLAMRMKFEPFFYWLFVIKPKKGK